MADTKEIGQEFEELAKEGELWSFVLNLMVASVMDFKKNPNEANGILIIPTLVFVALTIYIEKQYEGLYEHVNELVSKAIKKEENN